MTRIFTAVGRDIGVDRQKRRINGVAIITAGMANGEPVDEQSLDQFVALGNASIVRARVNHPNRADPAEIEQDLGLLVGQWTNFRRDGDVARADVQMLSANQAKGDEVLALAEEAPHLFGVSVVFDDAPAPGPKGRPRPKDAPARPVALYAADFVDIPASNAAGLFSKNSTENAMDPIEAYAKDGKVCATIGDKEYELKLPKEAFAKAEDDDDPEDDDSDPDEKDEDGEDEDDDTAEAKKKAKRAQARKLGRQLEQARADAVAAERAYRKTFATILSSAGLKDEAAAEFEKNFYGRSEADLKFLASHSIGARAKPVGEGGANDAAATDEQKAAKKQQELEAQQTRRFAERSELRRSFGVRSDDAADPAYQAGLKRYLAAEKNFAKPAPKLDE